MTKNFRKKDRNLIKKVVREKRLKLFTMRIYLGEYSKCDVIEICEFLLRNWSRMYHNHYSIFFKWFLGFVRELIVEIDGEVCRPYLHFLFFADRRNLPFLAELKNLAFISFLKTFRASERTDNLKVPLEEVALEDYEKVIDDLLLPCIRVLKSNSELEELLEVYQYGKQLCSRGGIVSRKKLERDITLEL